MSREKPLICFVIWAALFIYLLCTAQWAMVILFLFYFVGFTAIIFAVGWIIEKMKK
jgi:hypothetical protein